MKKFCLISSLAFVACLLAACGNDDPPIDTVYAQSPMLNHVHNTLTGDTYVSISSASLAIAGSEAVAMTSVKLDNENTAELTLDKLVARYSDTSGAYLITSPSFIYADGYDITDFSFRLDMSYSDYKSHHMSFIANGEYLVNSIQSTVQLKQCTTSYMNGSSLVNDTQGTYRIGFDIDNDMADVTIEDVFSLAGNRLNFLFAGLKLEPTAQGFHISLPADATPVPATDRNEQMVACDLNFDMQHCILSGSYQINKDNEPAYICEMSGHLY